MPPRKTILAFLVRFVLLFALLAAPWPGVKSATGGYFRALCRLVFSADDGRRELSFETPGADSPRPDDTRIVIVNKALMNPDGSGPVRNLDVGFGWQAVALLLALILATPIPGKRKAWALVWGLLGIQCFLLLFLAFCIWTESAEISLVVLSPFWKATATGVQEAVRDQFNLAAPILIWILATFRRGDLAPKETLVPSAG